MAWPKSIFLFIFIVLLVTCESLNQDVVAVKLSHNGVEIANDSYVDIDDMGENEKALLCHTNKIDCCSPPSQGTWYFLNNNNKMIEVQSLGNNEGRLDFFFRDRGYSVVRLHRVGKPIKRGRFLCKIPDSNNEMQKLYTSIMNLGAVVISHSGHEIAGRSFNLNCSIDINPYPLPDTIVSQPSFEWFFTSNNSSLPSGVTVSNVTNNVNTFCSSLQFSSLQKSHEGMYTCRFGGNGRLAVRKMINVLAAEFSQHPHNRSVNRGEEVELRCTFPLDKTFVNITWSAPSVDLSPMTTSLNGSTISTVTFTATNSSYSGNYFCTAHLSYTTVPSEEATLTLNYITVEFTMPVYTVSKIDGFKLPVEVKVFGSVSRNASVYFEYKNGEIEFVQNDTVSIKSFSGIQILQIPMNIIVMLLENDLLSIITVTITTEDPLLELSGNDSTYIIIEAVQIVHGEISLGKNETITCNSIIPVDVIEWLNSDGDIIASEDNTNQLSLDFAPVNISIHNRQYTCRANKSGSVNKTITLSVAVKLCAAPNITTSSAMNNSITIFWHQDLANDVHYELEYTFTIIQCEGTVNSSGNTVVLNSTLRSYTISNSTKTPVEEDSVFNIYLIALCSNGEMATTGLEIITSGAAPTGVPLNIRETFVGDTTISFAWDPVNCTLRNGEINEYNVNYYPETDSEKSMTVIVSHHTFTAFGLLFNETYLIKVHAVNVENEPGPAATINVTTLPLQGILITRQGRSYQNHSVVNIEAADTTDPILQCHTMKTSCCKFDEGGEGEWIFPNGSIIQNNKFGADLYRTRETGPGVVNLKWRMNAMIPSGIFCCMIPDPDETACIGVYPENEGIPMILTITMKSGNNDLICTSTGGPATIVYWTRDGQPLITDSTNFQQMQRVVSTVNAIYENTLHIPDDSIENYNATYECSVMNSRGNDSSNITVEAVQIIHGKLSLGENGTITCITLITVDVIEWLNSDGDIIDSENNTNRLNFTFSPVDITIHNRQYTCRANKSGSVNKTVTLSVSVGKKILNVKINISGRTLSIGKMIVINCTAKLLYDETKSPVPVLTLKHPNGTNISSVVGTEFSVVYDSVHSTDAGEFTCIGEIFFSELNNLSIVVESKENISLMLPTPKANITYSNSLIAGSTTTLNCTVDVNMIDDLDIIIYITWLRSEAVLSNDHERVVISEVSVQQSTFTSQLTLSPLSATDTNITCSAAAYLVSSNVPIISENGTSSDVVELNIQAPLLSVEISENATPTSGQNYTLTCIISGTDNLDPTVAYQWSKKIDTEVVIDTTSENLSFSPLRLFDAGDYYCTASISSPYLNQTFEIISKQQFRVELQIPNPASVNITQPLETVFWNNSFTLTCIVNLPTTVDVPITVKIRIESDGSTLIPPNLTMMESYTQYKVTATFIIDSLHQSRLLVKFICEANISSNSIYILPNNETTTDTVNITIVGPPSKPSDLKTVADSTSINISWETNNDDIIHRYELMYSYSIRECQNMTYGMKVFMNSSLDEYTLEDLEEDSDFNISLIAINPAGRSQAAISRNNTLQTDPDGPPTSVRVDSVNLTSIIITWEPVNCIQQNSIITKYKVSSLSSGFTAGSFIITNVTEATIINLNPNTEYTIEVRAVSENNLIGPPAALKSKTRVPQAIRFLLNDRLYDNNSVVSSTDIGSDASALFCLTNNTECCSADGNWYLPTNDAIPLLGSSGDIYQVRDQNVVHLNKRESATLPSGVFRCSIPDAEGQLQNIYIGIYAKGGAVMVKDLTFDKSIQTLSCVSTGGPPTTVTWMKNGIPLKTDTAKYSQTQEIVNASTSTYITKLSINSTDHNEVISNYTCTVNNSRVTSKLNQSLTVEIQVSESGLTTSTPLTSSAVYAAIVIIFLVVLLLALVIVVLYMRRKRHGKLTLFSERVKSKPRSTRFVVHSTPLHGEVEDNGEQNNSETLEMSTFGKNDSTKYKGEVVQIDKFDKHVEKMHEDRDRLFEIEYDSISKEPQNSHAIADIVVNRLRNRFANIFPYDHCRVKLKQIAGAENSDYINTSYMDGYEKPGAYIAAQGPLPNTLDDFWRMIWEKRLTTIVMLTQCFEGRKKCEFYWPENINDILEPGQGIKVVLASMTPFSEYTVRNLTVTKSSEPELPSLNIVQLHFLAWPDHGVPNNCAVMLNFVRRVRKLHPYSNPCPLLVHCSAGVGRTGTFIVLDSMLERMKTEGTLNVYDFVKQLRTQRVLMVQTQTQYIFIHDALKEVIMCGQTEIPAADIRNIIRQLSMQSDPCSASSGFEHQFQVLNQVKYVPEEDGYTNATSEPNMGKNRYPYKLPNNFYRVRMKSTATPGSDYINASYIDGYRQKNTYIATQGPLENTVCDFWRMVWEKESKCVVLLSKQQEQGEDMCYCYWPTNEGEVKTYGQITVKLMLEEIYGDYNLRKFEINEDKPGVVGVKTAFTVTQFHFLVWSEHDTPPITSSLIELISNVNKVQRGSGGRPMIIMCNDGMGRTGTFICIHAQLERLKTEGVFDFFQFIKSARMQRSGLVSDCTQYVLCHEVLADYLDSFDFYANFKEVM